jgi:hypothetical protein
MNSNSQTEHFVTLFDSNFLPMGMALHNSLMSHGEPFHLWILCMDELVEKQLERISLPHVTLMPLRAVETKELCEVKPGRTRGEYCWTITPFTFQAVFDRNRSVERVTYLDADLFFFSSPRILLRELDESGKDVLITEHAYGPEHNYLAALSGRFCVQFLTFRSTDAAKKVMRWWQERCLEWCFDRWEGGKFGDQKYLDLWPELFAEEVQVVRQTEKTLAPWNEILIEKIQGRKLEPVFYHFHGFRIVGPHMLRLYVDYLIGRRGLALYKAYVNAIVAACRRMKMSGVAIPVLPEMQSWPYKCKLLVQRRLRYKFFFT